MRGPRAYDFVKRLFDAALALVLLVLVSPIWLLVSVAILIQMGGPVLFRQQRPGKNERVFTLYKFRTMKVKAPTSTVAETWATDAERITGLGKFLRATSLDELPQLLNILKGDMSFIGPRPLLVEYLKYYSPEQAKRHLVRPGMTGWAQVNGRNALSWEERFELDAWYAENYSAVVDARILWRSIETVFSRRGARPDDQVTTPPFTGSGTNEDPQ